MKKLMVMFAVCFLVMGCGASRLSTRIAIQVGDGFIKTSSLGIPEMKKVIVAWPYISGQIASMPHPEDNISGQAAKVITELDKFSAQKEWTDKECGQISTDLVLIEYYAAQFGWDRYGVTITKWFKALMGG